MIGQMIKYRSLRLVLIANPGMMYGGFARESKHAIFEGMKGVGEPLLPWVIIPADLSLDGQLRVLSELDQPYPIVLKPDIGYRGQGVGVVGDEAEAAAYLDTCPVDVIAQPRVDGSNSGFFISAIRTKKLVGWHPSPARKRRNWLGMVSIQSKN